MSLGEHNMCKNGLQGYCKFNLVGKWLKQMARISERWSFLPDRNGLDKRVFYVDKQILLFFSHKKSADKN